MESRLSPGVPIHALGKRDRSDGIGCSRDVTVMDSMKLGGEECDGLSEIREAQEVSTIDCVERSADEEVNGVGMAEEVGVIAIDAVVARSV